MKLFDGIPCDEEAINCSAYVFFRQASEKDPFVWASDFEGKNIHMMFLANRIGKAAQGFFGLGLEPGERVALFLPRMPHAVSCFYALTLLGAVGVFLDPEASEEEMARLIDELDCQMVVACDYNKGRASQAAASVYPGIPMVVANFGEDQMFPRNALYPLTSRKDRRPVSKDVSLYSWKQFKDAAKKAGVVDVPVTNGSSIACVMLEEDAEGNKVAVSYTNAELNATALRMAEVMNVTLEDDALFTDVPIHTFDGMAIGIHGTLGNLGYVLQGMRNTPEDSVRMILKKKPAAVYGSKELYEALITAKDFANVKLPFLKTAFCRGMSEDQKARALSFLDEHGSKAQLIDVS